MEKGKFLFLGTGGSSGIPRIGCSCPVCRSEDPRNKRLRPSGLLECLDKKILIDAGPDFRFQALKHQINHLDGLLLTHSHFDHIAGIDELRVYYLMQRKPLPVLLSEPTYDEIRKRYGYFFEQRSPENSLTVQLDFHRVLEERAQVTFLGLPLILTRYHQAGMPVTGYRLGSFAYISDIRQYPETIFEDLQGVATLVLSMLREKTSHLHLGLEEAIAFAHRTGARQTYFTHMSHEIEHATISKQLPEGFFLAYDGLKVDFTYDR